MSLINSQDNEGIGTDASGKYQFCFLGGRFTNPAELMKRKASSWIMWWTGCEARSQQASCFTGRFSNRG